MPQSITPCLWFDGQVEEAARFYIGIFKDPKISKVSYYGTAGREIHGGKAGSVLAVAFELDGQSLTAMNDGPQFKFNEAISLQVNCATQEEVNHYWDKLSAGGEPEAQACGWLKDRNGASWQVVPTVLLEMLAHPDQKKADLAMLAMLKMKKLDIAALQRAFAG
jgi:predicted 3-demethylubiquinone-9 3-methyltransferase (glyoxalase superfamily)